MGVAECRSRCTPQYIRATRCAVIDVVADAQCIDFLGVALWRRLDPPALTPVQISHAKDNSFWLIRYEFAWRPQKSTPSSHAHCMQHSYFTGDNLAGKLMINQAHPHSFSHPPSGQNCLANPLRRRRTLSACKALLQSHSRRAGKLPHRRPTELIGRTAREERLRNHVYATIRR